MRRFNELLGPTALSNRKGFSPERLLGPFLGKLAGIFAFCNNVEQHREKLAEAKRYLRTADRKFANSFKRVIPAADTDLFRARFLAAETVWKLEGCIASAKEQGESNRIVMQTGLIKDMRSHEFAKLDNYAIAEFIF